MNRSTALCIVLAAAGAALTGPAQAAGWEGQQMPVETKEQRDQRMAWWRAARFGLFIHWGLYAVPAGEWQGSTHHGEWIMHSAQIPLADYGQFRARFNPVRFDADAWARCARDAGMQYVVITSKHHDGFCLFDSQQTDYDVMSTPFRRDILKELADACRRHGLRICWYYSIMDWHHPDYLPRRPWEERSAAGADFARYVAYLKHQVRELLTNYGPIGVMWFDGEWEDTWQHEHGLDLYNYVRSIDPAVIINNRVDKGRAGMAGMTVAGGFAGDFGTPEQEIPPTGLPGVDWETCMTMNDHWGYNKYDKNWKSSAQLIRMLVDIASKGGNFLLNVGPTAEGEFPPECVERLRDIGTWMKTNGQAIYDTAASPFRSLPWGRCTQKRLPDGSTRLYFFVFDWPQEGRLVIPGLLNEAQRAQLLVAGGSTHALDVRRAADALVVSLPPAPPDPVASVVVLDIAGMPDVVEPPVIAAEASIFVDALEVSAVTDRGDVEVRFTTDGSEPTAASALATGPVRVTDTVTLKARLFRDGKPVSPLAAATFTRVTPRPPERPASSAPGLSYEYYEGDWNELPDFARLRPLKSGMVPNFVFTPRERGEYFAFRYAGFVNVPRDGVYTFYTASDDGSRLYIGERLVVDNDGLHGVVERSGQIALAAGLHPITVTFFEKSGGDLLEVFWSGPDMGKQRIADQALVHAPAP